MNGLQSALPRVPMQHDVFNHYDGVIDYQSHRRGKPAKRHQVEALVQQLQGDKRDCYGHGDHQAGYYRCTPIAQENYQNY